MKPVLIAIIILLFNQLSSAQNRHFPSSGIIRYEKKINMYALFKREINRDNESILEKAFEQYKKSNPQFLILKSELFFQHNISLFKPSPEEERPAMFYFGESSLIGQFNDVYTDFSLKKTVTQKMVYDHTYLIKDSLKKITWKITDEIREIQGYRCRRANGITVDSVYIVAFYTGQIPVSSGPESFSGLPGMILQLAIPHENLVWIATEITDEVLGAKILPPSKGDVKSFKEMNLILKSAMKGLQHFQSAYFTAYSL